MAARYDLADETIEAQVELAQDFNNNGWDTDDVDTEVLEHPEGEKRGGLVKVHHIGNTSTNEPIRIFYCETACAWFSYDG